MKKFLSIITIVACIFSAFSVTVTATTTKSINEDTWVSVNKDSLCKMTISGEGYITVYSKCDGTYDSAEISVLNNRKNEIGNDMYVTGKKTRSIKVAVSKGTYYVNIDDIDLDSTKNKIYVKYVFTSITQKTNYCVSNAISMKQGTKYNIYQTPKYNFDRWYKIALEKNAKLKIEKYISGCYIDIYSSDGNMIDTDTDYDDGVTTFISEDKLASGTYYVVVTVDDWSSPFDSTYGYIKWIK